MALGYFPDIDNYSNIYSQQSTAGINAAPLSPW
jgi:hypothetical protein